VFGLSGREIEKSGGNNDNNKKLEVMAVRFEAAGVLGCPWT